MPSPALSRIRRYSSSEHTPCGPGGRLRPRNSEAAITMIPWAWRLLPRIGNRSLSTPSTNQRAEDHHRQLEAYGYFLPIQTRWQDNDQYGHVNNTVYYSYFDTIINHYLISWTTNKRINQVPCVIFDSFHDVNISAVASSKPPVQKRKGREQCTLIQLPSARPQSIIQWKKI